MYNPQVPRQRVPAAKRLLHGVAVLSSDLELLTVVDRVFMASEVVRAGEVGVAGLARLRVDPVARVRACLCAFVGTDRAGSVGAVDGGGRQRCCSMPPRLLLRGDGG